jgi:hypothetical protein
MKQAPDDLRAAKSRREDSNPIKRAPADGRGLGALIERKVREHAWYA